MVKVENEKEMIDALGALDPAFRLRQDYCGSKFDLAKLKSAGFEPWEDGSGDNVSNLAVFKTKDEAWGVGCCYNQHGELLDVLLEVSNRVSFDMLPSPADFPFEAEVRMKLDGALVSSFEPAEQSDIHYLLNVLESLKSQGLYPQLKKVVGEVILENGDGYSMARKCLVEVVRSPDLLPKDMFLKAAFLAHELDLEAEWYFLMDKVVPGYGFHWQDMICSMLRHGVIDMGIKILLYTAEITPMSPQWEMIYEILNGPTLDELFVAE